MSSVPLERALTDSELLELVRRDSDNLDIIYKKHKAYCINFMKSRYDNEEEIRDIYHDAVIVLYEKALDPHFTLSCSIQTYLTSICYNQVKVRLQQAGKRKVEDMEVHNERLEDIGDWFDQADSVNNERVVTMQFILQEMQGYSNRCYDILIRFFYHNQTMDQIALDLGYTNADNAKNQKYRCQEKLKKEVYNRLNRI